MGSNRGLSRVVFSINDFAASNPNIPNDDQQFYLRIQEVDMSGTATGYSPILVIPPPEAYFFRKAPMTLVGTAGGSGIWNNFDYSSNSRISKFGILNNLNIYLILKIIFFYQNR